MIPPVVLIIGAALFVIAWYRRGTAVPSGAENASNWQTGSGTVGRVSWDTATVSNAMIAKIATLAEEIDHDLVITSGLRSPQEQASAMLSKVRRGEDLHALYRADELVAVLLALPSDVEQWATVIQEATNAGIVLSDHLIVKGDIHAIDLRSRDLEQSTIDAIVANAGVIGLRAVLESDHIHLEP